MTQAFGSGCIVLAGFYYLFPVVIIPPDIFWSGYLLVCVFLAVCRFLYVFALEKRFFAQPIMVLGTKELAAGIAHEVMEKLDSGFRIVAFVGPEEAPSFDIHGAPYYRDGQHSLPELCQRHEAEMIVVALEDRRGTMAVKDLIDCKLDGVAIVAGIGFYEDLTGKIMVEKVNPDWIIFSSGFTVGRGKNFLKRFADIVLSSLGLLLASPLMVLAALIIKLESPGPVFYRQERVGERGVPFEVIKFRSMCQDAEKDGAVWAQKNDSRVTRFGGLIRKVRIDELPQLWNVLKGEMSFVGPRPERPVFVKELARKIPYYSLRHNIKPGVTGWAQVCYPYGASEEDALRKLEYDLYYLKNLSLSIDLWIIFQTVKTVLFQKGSR
jgi:sugar transferase (PEP-CTERM system associated)